MKDKLYIALNGSKLFRIKVKSPEYNNIHSGELDLFIELYGPLDKIYSFYSTDKIIPIGNMINEISWHSFTLKNGHSISPPKVHFKRGRSKSDKTPFNSGDYVKNNDVIPYPVLSIILMSVWPQNVSTYCETQTPVMNLEALFPVCIDLFILPRNIDSKAFINTHDASSFIVTSTHAIFMESTNYEFEFCRYGNEPYPQIVTGSINGWDIFLRLSNPPSYSKILQFPSFSIISFDLKNAVSSLLDRPVCYPNDSETLLQTTFRERLNPENIKYKTMYYKKPTCEE